MHTDLHSMPCHIPEVPDETSRALFAAMSFDAEGRVWEQETDLRHALAYARGSKRLAIPDEWRHLIPKSIDL